MPLLTIPASSFVCAMAPENPAAARAASGDIVCFETRDCYAGQIATETPCWNSIDWSLVNPATGPL